MAHFAKINTDGTVGDIIVIANDVLKDENGDEQETLGAELIESLGLGGRWVQCSYNGLIRGSYPGTGYLYDEIRDAFIPPTPYPSWVLDEATCLWVAPIPMPDGDYVWDEDAGDWVATDATL